MLRGRKLKDLVEEGLRLVLETKRKTRRRQSLAELTKRAHGVVDSGIPDLGSNPDHLMLFPVELTHDSGLPRHCPPHRYIGNVPLPDSCSATFEESEGL